MLVCVVPQWEHRDQPNIADIANAPQPKGQCGNSRQLFFDEIKSHTWQCSGMDGVCQQTPNSYVASNPSTDAKNGTGDVPPHIFCRNILENMCSSTYSEGEPPR